MALVKCKECGGDVSTKAKTCPKCGAKAPKKTSIFTWLVLIFIIFTIYVGNQSSTSTASSQGSTASSDSAQSESGKKLLPVKSSWVVQTSKDEMTGKFLAYASSPTTHPSKRMAFPYKNVNSWMGVGCDSNSEWVYFGFNSAPNLTKDETKDGYNLIKTRIKWDGQVESVSLTQNWGAKFINFRNNTSTIPKISSSNSVLLELQWHGEQPTYFEYSLNGSSKAIAKLRAKCLASK